MNLQFQLEYMPIVLYYAYYDVYTQIFTKWCCCGSPNPCDHRPVWPPLSKPCFVDQHVELFWLTRATLAAGAWLEGRRAAATAAPPVRSHETEQKSTLNILLDPFNPVIMLHVSEQNFITSQCAIYTSSVSASSCQHHILSGKAGEAPLQQVNHRTSQHLRCKWVFHRTVPMSKHRRCWESHTQNIFDMDVPSSNM